MAAQHLVRDDGIENRLPLPGMEIHRARVAGLVHEPPAQQFRRGGCDQFQNLGIAVFQTEAKLLGAAGEIGCQWQRATLATLRKMPRRAA